MGWRISLYSVSKRTASKWKDITEEEYREKNELLFEELEKETIKYDTLTDIISKDMGTCVFSSRFFTNKLSIESDMYFGTISKEQLLNIIEEVRVNHIIKYFDGRRIDGDDKLGELWQEIKEKSFNNEWDVSHSMKANQGEWNIKADRWKCMWWNKYGSKTYLNINLDENNKWLVSGSDYYEYLIFDLIHILKIFDFENDVLLCIGG